MLLPGVVLFTHRNDGAFGLVFFFDLLEHRRQPEQNRDEKGDRATDPADRSAQVDAGHAEDKMGELKVALECEHAAFEHDAETEAVEPIKDRNDDCASDLHENLVCLIRCARLILAVVTEWSEWPIASFLG